MPFTHTPRRPVRPLQKWLGSAAHTEDDLLALVEAGLPLSIVERFEERGLAKSEVLHIVHPRTLKHRKSRSESLSREESERALRTARLLAHAEGVMGDPDAALRWMRAGKKRFGGRTPFEMIATEPGGRMVEQLLTQIDHGMFA